MTMIYFALYLPFLLSFIISQVQSPGAGLFTTKQEASRYDCRATSRAANQQEKNISEDSFPRGNFITETAFRCSSLFFEKGERDARAQAILDNLDTNISKILNLAKQESPKPLKWSAYVQVNDDELNYKIKFALEVQLAALNEKVNTELPQISEIRTETLAKLEPEKSIKDLCKDLPSLEVGWLGVGQIHPKETQLQGGLCYRGVWKWLL